MTRAEKEARATLLRTTVESQVKAYNEAMLENKFDEATKIDSETVENVNEYTGLVRDMTFEDIAATPDPMKEACKRLSFQTIAVKDVKEGESRLPTRKLIDRDKPIDLLKLHKFVKEGIGHDKDWNYMVEKLNLLLTCQVAKDIGVDPKDIYDSYDMAVIARQYDLGKNPASKTNLLKTLTTIVHAMIGDEYKPVSHDVNFLLRVYSKKSRKALTVSCANHRYMRSYCMEICHKLIENKEYGVEYQEKKKA